MSTLREYLNTPPEYAEGTIEALQHFKAHYREWKQGDSISFQEASEIRLGGMQTLVKAMAIAEGVVMPDVMMTDIKYGRNSGYSYYDSHSNVINMVGKLSIITLLHEFAHAKLGRDEREMQRWSLCLFKKVYPKAFEKLYPIENENGVFLVPEPSTSLNNPAL